MKTRNVNIKLNGVNYKLSVTFQRGQYNRYLLSSEKGEYRNFDVAFDKDATGENFLFSKAVLKAANDKSSCYGNWYAHCNGYAKDVVYTKGRLCINTYSPYNN